MSTPTLSGHARAGDIKLRSILSEAAQLKTQVTLPKKDERDDGNDVVVKG
jgi:hypothetical protein